MRYMISAVLLFLTATLQVHADICAQLEPMLKAFDEGNAKPVPFALNEGETECIETTDEDGFGLYGCYWDSTDFIHYDTADLERLAEGLNKCGFIEPIVDKLSDELGVEYSYLYGVLTIMHVGNDDQGIYLEITEDWGFFPF